MNIALDPKYEPFVRDKLLRGEYQTAEEVISAAMQLLSEQDEDRRIVVQVDGGEPLLLDERFGPRLEMLLQEAEDSGEPTEMTSQDWDEIRREGLALIKSPKVGVVWMARLLRREAAKRDLIAHFVYLGENASTEVAERFLLAAEQAAKSLAQMPEIGIRGKVRRGKYAGVRIWPVPGFDKYLIVYWPIKEGVQVERVVHAAQDYRRVLG